VDREVISYMTELTQQLVKNNYEVDQKNMKPLVVFASNACVELTTSIDKSEKLEKENKDMRDYIAKVAKFLSAPDTIQPAAKEFVTFLLAKARSFK
jgi:hypothetical protein